MLYNLLFGYVLLIAYYVKNFKMYRQICGREAKKTSEGSTLSLGGLAVSQLLWH
jgi:hypothetical protein